MDFKRISIQQLFTDKQLRGAVIDHAEAGDQDAVNLMNQFAKDQLDRTIRIAAHLAGWASTFGPELNVGPRGMSEALILAAHELYERHLADDEDTECYFVDFVEDVMGQYSVLHSEDSKDVN